MPTFSVKYIVYQWLPRFKVLKVSYFINILIKLFTYTFIYSCIS